MSRLLYTVDDMVNEVRSLLDEDNTDTINTSSDILPALNRAQEFASNIYARKYQEPLLQYSTITITSGTAEYTIPENVFEDRVTKLEAIIPIGSGNNYQEIQGVSHQEIGSYESASNTNIPDYFTIYGRTIRFAPTPDGTYNVRMWYMREPERLVLKQGRITDVNTGSNYVDVDSIGSDLSTNTDNLASFVNIIDGQTGEIKSTMQIQSIDTSNSRITFRSSPTESIVLGRTIGTSLASTTEDNDYLCLVQGTCVPFFRSPTVNFMIYHATSALKGKLEDSDFQKEMLDAFEKQVMRTWVGRSKVTRVRKVNPIWGATLRRYRIPRSN